MKAQHQEPTDRLSPTRRSRGRPFQKGNPGRRPGSVNRSTLIAHAISDADKEEMVRKGIELAKGGDSQMLRFFLDRILPKEQPIQIGLPDIQNHSDLADAHSAIVKAVSSGELSATGLADMLHKIARFLPDVEIEYRLRALETELKVLQRAQGEVE